MKLLIRIIVSCIPFKKYRSYVRMSLFKKLNLEKKQIDDIQTRLNKKVQLIRQRNKPIKVGFLVVLDSCFQMNVVYELMKEDPSNFEVKILVVPDVARGATHQENQLGQTYNSLVGKYGASHVYIPRAEGGDWIDISDKYDVVFTMCPYSEMMHRLYRIPYLAKRGVLVCYSRYYTFSDCIWEDHADSLLDLRFLWRFYAESEFDKKRMISLQSLLAYFERIVAVGCPKLDNFIKYTKSKIGSTRKRVIIAPHHSVLCKPGSYSIGNFILYSHIYLDLPRKYPQIDFIFRPHPLLFYVLCANGIWTEEDVNSYISKMEEYKNCVYQKGGDYFDTFVNSDAMIQDCGAFLPEYFYVDHPQCYIIRSKKYIKSQYGDWGMKMLDACYVASTESQIIDFLDNVVLEGKDEKGEHRKIFYERELKRNYPYSSQMIVEDIKKHLLQL